jgi:transcriptional regulator with XRE-family HTH domain
VNAKDHGYQRAYKSFRERLEQARRQAGLTQVQVAKRLNRPHSYISKCELGERRVDVVELRQLAKLYRKPMSFFWS